MRVKVNSGLTRIDSVKIRAVIQDGRWRYLAALLDSRMLLFVFFLMVFAPPFYNTHSHSFVDRNLFRFGVLLQSQHLDASEYIRVEVSPVEMQNFLHDPLSATPMLRLLDQMQSSQMKSATIVLHQKLWKDYAVASLLEHANLAGLAVQQDLLQAVKKNIGIYQSFLVNKNIRQLDVADSANVQDSLYPLLPYFTVENKDVIPDQIKYPLSRFSDRSALPILQNKIVIIGEKGDVSADDLLMSDASIKSLSYATFAPWYIQLHIAISLFILFFLLLLPFFTLRIGAFLTLILLVAMCLGQQIVFIVHKIWFPLSPWLTLLIVGHVLVLLWCIRRSFYGVNKIGAANEVVRREPVGRKVDKKSGESRKFWKFSEKKSINRVPPTLMGGNNADELDDTNVLDQTKPMQRPLSNQAKAQSRKIDFLGRYRIEKELGRGAMGVVYLGFDPKISRKVAIKTLHYNQFEASELPAVKERFFREAAAAGKLRHPNIVTIYDAGEEPDLAYIAMDYVQGDSLSAHIRKDQLLDVELVYYIMALVSDAVSDANSQGIIHRDIKPSNILYDSKTNEVKVADFGIARILDGSATRTKTGDLVGSPLYMSPEQIKGDHVGPQSDIFSLGVTFYQLLTGELPFKGDSLANLSYQIIQCKYRPVDEVRPGLPASAQRIIAKALNKSPANRFQSAAEMHDVIQRAYSKDFS